MGALKNQQSGELAILRARHAIGRNRSDVHLLISDADISRHHADVYWQDEAWWLRDLSRNGVWLNERRVDPAQAVVISAGDELHFAGHGRNVWVLAEAGPPQSVLLPISHDGEILPLGISSLLPAEDPVVEIFREDDDRWLLIRDGHQQELRDADRIEINGETWQVQLVPDSVICQPTEATSVLNLDCMLFQFFVSQDEEHVQLTVKRDDGQQAEFGERSHHYLLVTLARKRYLDAIDGFDQEAQGWLDREELCRMLAMDPQHINIQIFRIRKQLAKLLNSCRDSGDVVERRVGGMRLRSRRFQIFHSGRLEGEMPLDREEVNDSLPDGGESKAT